MTPPAPTAERAGGRRLPTEHPSPRSAAASRGDRDPRCGGAEDRAGLACAPGTAPLRRLGRLGRVGGSAGATRDKPVVPGAQFGSASPAGGGGTRRPRGARQRAGVRAAGGVMVNTRLFFCARSR